MGRRSILGLPDGGDAARRSADFVAAVLAGITDLQNQGYAGPYALVLATDLYRLVHRPTPNLVLPRHAILPLLEDGPLLHFSQLKDSTGLVIAYGSGQVEQVLASDISVRLLQVNAEPRFVFRVSERVALRVRDWNAIAKLEYDPKAGADA